VARASPWLRGFTELLFADCGNCGPVKNSARIQRWRESLKWQRLEPYEKFAEMIDRHRDGISAYCKPENKVSLGFVVGLNNKIGVIQRRATDCAMKNTCGSRC
jgi:transposase